MSQRKRRKMKGGGNRLAGIASLPSAISNHPQWYEHYPLEHLMGINFGMREKLGRTIPGPFGTSTPNIDSAPDATIALELVIPTGTTAYRESMQILMNKLRAASGSNITYTVNDLGAYTLNAREIYALYSVARKIILETRITDIYDQDAHIKYAVAATGRAATNLASITQNLASDTTRLNRLAGVISAMIPIRMSLLERTAWLFSNIFADSTTAKFSTKQFIMNHSKKWVADNTNDKVTTSDWQLTATTLTGIIDRLEELVGYFTANTQNSRIAGDLMKAFGSFFTMLSPVTEATRIAPIYDEAALTQIQNLTICPAYDNGSSTLPTVEITSTGATVQYPGESPATPAVAKMFASYQGANMILNSYKDSLTPGEIVSVTRLSAACGVVVDNAVNVVTITNCGTEVAVNYRYITAMAADGTISVQDYSPGTAAPTAAGAYMTIKATEATFILADLWSRDDWAPMMCLFWKGTLAAPTDTYTLFDLSNWASIDQKNLSVFHQAACLSLTATPSSIIEQSSFRFLS